MVYTGFKQQAAEIAKQREGITHDFKDVTGGIEELAAFGFEISPEFKETSSESDTGKSEERTSVGQDAARTSGGDQGPGGAKGYATKRKVNGSNETSAEGKPVENNGRNNNEAGKGTKTLAEVDGQTKLFATPPTFGKKPQPTTTKGDVSVTRQRLETYAKELLCNGL